MGNAALVTDNFADTAIVGASSQVLTMPATALKTPHPSERWRSLSNAAWFVVDKGQGRLADTVMVGGLTCGPNATVRLRLSTIDASGAAGDVLDTEPLAAGDAHFSIDYESFVYRLDAPAVWRYLRFDIIDPDATYVEAGCVVDGLSEQFAYNFVPGGSIQHVDRSRISTTSSGVTLVWPDSRFRRVDLSFPWVSEEQRFGLIERLDRVCGRRKNVLLVIDPDSNNLPRASIFGLVTDITPVTFGVIFDLYGKQLRIEERI